MLQLRIPSAFPSSGEGSGGGVRPLSRHHVGNRACVAARPERRHPQLTPHLLRGLAGGVSGSLTAMRARFRAFQHGQQSQDMTGSACRFWRGLCVRAGSMLARRVSQVLWSTPVGNRACAAARPGKKTPSANPSLVTGISWGCLRVVDGNAGTVSSSSTDNSRKT